LSETIPLCIPHTRIGDATEVFLATYGCVPENMPVERIDVSGSPSAYLDYLEARWDEGKTFVNLEHDIVPWPGALQELNNCPRNWCFFGYLPGLDFVEISGAAPFGLVRFRSSFIATVPDVWKNMRRRFADRDDPHMWRINDIELANYTKERGLFTPHQHSPSVLNANPKFIPPPPVAEHEHEFVPSPAAIPGITPVLVCTFEGCEEFRDQT